MFTVVLEIEAKTVDAGKTIDVVSPTVIGGIVQQSIPLGNVVSGWKLKGSRLLASGSRTGYISGVGR
jgi:hypothetical protein